MFGGGGGGLNPRKMKQMMEQMGIDMEEIDATEVVIRADDRELVFEAPEVTKMDARGNETYTVVGSPEVRGDVAEDGDDETEADDDDGGIPEDDVELVAQRAGVSKGEAREALEASDGDLAAAIDSLE